MVTKATFLSQHLTQCLAYSKCSTNSVGGYQELLYITILLGCDIMIYSQKYLFGLHPCFWNRAPKAFEIS